jgi:hypothetical protein
MDSPAAWGVKMAAAGLLAVGAGLLLGGGYLYWKSKQEAGQSACEKMCLAGADLAGFTGDKAKLCKGTCGVLGDPKAIVNAVGATMTSIVQKLPLGSHRSDQLKISGKCPAGSHIALNSTLDSSRDNYGRDASLTSILADSRGYTDGVFNASACYDDATGKIVGHLTAAGFEAWTEVPTQPPPPLVIPLPPAEGTATSSRGPRGGVSVT